MDKPKPIYCVACGAEMVCRQEAGGREARCVPCKGGFQHISVLLNGGLGVWEKPDTRTAEERQLADAMKSALGGQQTW